MPHHGQEIHLWTRLFEITACHVANGTGTAWPFVDVRLHGVLEADEKLTAVECAVMGWTVVESER